VEIGQNAFLGQTDREYFPANRITEIVIPESVVKIGNSAFYEMNNLKSVNIPARIEIIENLAFAGCINLETLRIPDSLTKINFGDNVVDQTFGRCGKLPLKTRQRLKELGYEGRF